MSEKVGSIHYDVTLETGSMVEGQRKVGRELDKTTGSLDRFSAKLSGVASAISVLAVAMAALKSAQMADDMRLLGAKVEVAAGSIESGAAAMAALEAISKRTSTSVAANAEVFTRLNQSMLQMGGTQQDTLNMTELLGKAIRVSGASAVEAKSAMLQFGQALGSGKLAGDELRSLMENAPYLMRQLADGIGVPVGALKQLGEDGKLTADVVTNALSKAATQIDADFQKFPQTIASAMDVAMDAAGRANLKLDELTGTSAALTGVIKGTGEVLDELAIQFGEATGEADKLGKNESIKTWADAAKFALSYVIDAGDGVVRTFKAVGTSLGGLIAAAGAALSGEFSEAKTILGMIGSDLDAIASKQLAGARMRDQFTSGQVRAGPAKGPTGTIKSTTGSGKAGSAGKGKGKGQKFDALSYLAELRSKTVSAIEQISIAETEAVRKADELLATKKLSREQHEEAVTAIAQGAAKARKEIADKELSDFIDGALQFDEFIKDQEKKADEREQRRKNDKTNAKIDTLQIKAKDGGLGDQENLVRAVGAADMAEVEAKRIEAVRITDLEGAQIYADQKVAIERQMQQDIINMQAANNIASLSMAGSLSDSMYQLMEQSGSERSTLGKVLFAASKALAVAEIIISTEVAAAKAGAQLGIFGIPMASMIRATGYASAGMVSAMAIGKLSGGRQYGGPVSSGSMYRVNETGAPEMFTSNNGNQYMMPNKSGKVTAADKVGGSVVNNISVSVDSSGSSAQGNSAQATQLGNMIGNAVRGVLMQEKRPGGMLA